jgi:hypothetical protein
MKLINFEQKHQDCVKCTTNDWLLRKCKLSIYYLALFMYKAYDLYLTKTGLNATDSYLHCYRQIWEMIDRKK